jgi:hypothetical protein
MGYLADQGLLRRRRIQGAAKWTDRQWLEAAGVTAQEARAAAPLLRWRGGDVFARVSSPAKNKALKIE